MNTVSSAKIFIIPQGETRVIGIYSNVHFLAHFDSSPLSLPLAKLYLTGWGCGRGDRDGCSGSRNFGNYNKQVPVARRKTRPIVAQPTIPQTPHGNNMQIAGLPNVCGYTVSSFRNVISCYFQSEYGSRRWSPLKFPTYFCKSVSIPHESNIDTGFFLWRIYFTVVVSKAQRWSSLFYRYRSVATLLVATTWKCK